MPEIRLEHITKRWGKFYGVDDLNLVIENNAFVTLLGPSGCGKTTTLRMISGFEYPTSGNVFIGDRDVAKIPPNKRGISMVFQSYALFPHLNIWENIAYGLRVAKIPQDEIIRRTNDVVELMQLKGMEKRFPNQLSGGQQQRVALARTLTQDPQIILADEPVAALDPVTARQVMQDFVRINKEMGISILLNIHHVELALEYAERIIGIRAGKIVYDGPSANVDKAVLSAIYGDDSETEADA